MSNSEPAITIGGVPIPDNIEGHHILLLGAPGAGKTLAVKELLRAIRARGEGAVVYDPTGALAQDLYDPARDFIISPLDVPDLQVGDLAGRFVFLTHDLSREQGAGFIARVVDAPQTGEKVWLVLDELPYNVPTATIEAALAADSGITVIVAAQFRGQLQAHGYDALWSAPRTRLVLRLGDHETAELAARDLGVEPRDLMALPALSGFLVLRMSDDFCLKTDVHLEV